MAGIDNNTLLYLRGDSFTDLSLNPKSIANNGANIKEDITFTKCMNFTSSSYANLPANIFTSLLNTSEWTIEYYANCSTNPYIISSWDSNRYSFNFGVIPDSSNKYGFIARKLGNVGHNVINLSASKPTYNTWQHLACVKKDNSLSIYIDGYLSATGNFDGNINTDILNVYINRKGDSSETFDFKLCRLRISNIARYTENFTPPTQPFNSIAINITNQTRDKIDFNISKLGQEVVNKIEVLVNGQVFKTYDNIGDLTCDIDKSLLFNGNNKIKIKVTFDNDYTEEKEIDYEYVINNLSTSSSLKELIDRQEQLTNAIEVQKNNLKSILESKNVEVSEGENKLSILIQKVEELSSVAFIKELQDNQVQFLNEITLLEEENENLKQELTLIKNALNETLLMKMEV